MTTVCRHWLQAKTIEGCNSCASLAGLVLCFIVCFAACFILLVIAALPSPNLRRRRTTKQRGPADRCNECNDADVDGRREDTHTAEYA